MIYIGSDQVGYALKQVIKVLLEEQGYKFVDLGVFKIEEVADYPDIAREVAEKVAENGESEAAMGILIDQSGIGMMMAANHVGGVRATVVANSVMAELARKSTDANVICLGTQVVDEPTAKEAVLTFLNTEFACDPNDQRCIAKMTNISNGK